jgi:IS5 family transposase
MINQISLTTTGFELATKVTRKRELLALMDAVTHWGELLALIAPHAPAGKNGSPPFTLK